MQSVSSTTSGKANWSSKAFTSPKLVIGTLMRSALEPRSLDEVVERVRSFLPEAEIDCEDFADGTASCGATLGEGWISIIFDNSRRLTEVRIDAYHFI